MKSNFNKEQIKSGINALFNSKTEDQLIERDALMLQANYLSEIERLTKEKGINRKDIAVRIKTSPSYLTQVFRGDKPLNFITLAKIKRALDLRFEVTASFRSEKKTEIIPKMVVDHFQPYTTVQPILNKYLDNDSVVVQNKSIISIKNVFSELEVA